MFTTHCVSHVTCHVSCVNYHVSCVTCHVSHFMSHMSFCWPYSSPPVCHMSHFMCHMSHFRYHKSCVTKKNYKLVELLSMGPNPYTYLDNNKIFFNLKLENIALENISPRKPFYTIPIRVCCQALTNQDEVLLHT